MGKQAEPRRFRELVRGAGRDRAASRVVVSVLRADSKASQTLERALGAVGLSLPQFNVLMVLGASPDGALPIYELNARLVTSPPNMTWISDRMEERGFVRKRRDTADRRVVVIELTEGGWAALEGAAPVVFEAEKELVAGYSRAELKDLGNLLGPFLD